MKTSIWVTGAVVALLAVSAVVLAVSHGDECRDFSQARLKIDGQDWSVALAQTPAEQSLGLGGCTALPTRSGMYFPYDSPRQVSFWMKGMQIPIDIIWIAEGKMIGLQEYVPPPNSNKTDLLPQYRPPRPVDGVLETAAGEAQKNGWKIGDDVVLDKSI